jgi:hypothetical protein
LEDETTSLLADNLRQEKRLLGCFVADEADEAAEEPLSIRCD